MAEIQKKKNKSPRVQLILFLSEETVKLNTIQELKFYTVKFHQCFWFSVRQFEELPPSTGSTFRRGKEQKLLRADRLEKFWCDIINTPTSFWLFRSLDVRLFHKGEREREKNNSHCLFAAVWELAAGVKWLHWLQEAFKTKATYLHHKFTPSV